MITISSECASVLAGAGFVYRLNVESWIGGTLLASNVPVSAATEETDRSLTVPERVTFTIPRIADGTDWTPTSATAPLAAKGQHLVVKLGVGLTFGRTEWLTRGRFLIYESDTDEDSINVTAVGRLELINQARLINPFQPSGTIVSTLRALIEPALTVLVDGTLVDRSVPTAINYDEDRLGAVRELLDAWPASADVDPEGYLRVVPATQSLTPVLTLTDGHGGTVIQIAGTSTRASGANVIVARGTASDGSQVQGVAFITTGPDAYGGNYNPLPVPFFFQSPLLTTVTQCIQAANTIRDRRQRQAATEYRVEMVPHPALQMGDVVGLTSARLGLANVPCSIESLTLPYQADEGSLSPMVLKVKALT